VSVSVGSGTLEVDGDRNAGLSLDHRKLAILVGAIGIPWGMLYVFGKFAIVLAQALTGVPAAH
jgi:hypothetical protein